MACYQSSFMDMTDITFVKHCPVIKSALKADTDLNCNKNKKCKQASKTTCFLKYICTYEQPCKNKTRLTKPRPCVGKVIFHRVQFYLGGSREEAGSLEVFLVFAFLLVVASVEGPSVPAGINF